jgi:predicted acylesterase/phospholipase RssA
MSYIVKCLLTFLVALSIGGCGIFPSIPAYTHNNSRLEKRAFGDGVPYDKKIARTSFQAAAKVDETPDIFVGVALSGGGSRAAVFGAAVLSELDRLGFLSHVKVMSSVSGGSLPAAYFALNGHHIQGEQDWLDVMDTMSKSYRTELTYRQFAPHNILLTSATHYDRANLLAEVFDSNIFHGKSFADMAEYGPRQPTLIMNATDISSPEPRHFPFTAENFESHGTRIDNLPITTAIVASAAFPGLLNAVTLKSWHWKTKNTNDEAYVNYLHLIDGGAIDNLGITTLRAAARHFRERSAKQSFQCFMFLIDAYPGNTHSELRTLPDTRQSPTDYLIDGNIFNAVEALQLRRRFLDLANANIVIPNAAFHTPRAEYDPEWPNRSVAINSGFDIGTLDQCGGKVFPYARVTTMPLSKYGEMSQTTKKLPKPCESTIPTGSCKVWHISLSDLRSIENIPSDGAITSSQELVSDKAVLDYRNDLWNIVTRIDTDFDLTGPKGCDGNILKQSLLDAAHILVQEDRNSLEQACDWFRGVYGEKFANCGKNPPAYSKKDLPIKIKPIMEGRAGCEVACN